MKKKDRIGRDTYSTVSLLLTDAKALMFCDNKFTTNFVRRLAVLKLQQDICRRETLVSSHRSQSLAHTWCSSVLRLAWSIPIANRQSNFLMVYRRNMYMDGASYPVSEQVVPCNPLG